MRAWEADSEMRRAKPITKQLFIAGGTLALWAWSYYFVRDHVVYIVASGVLVLYITTWVLSAVSALAITRFGINREQPTSVIVLRTGEWSRPLNTFRWWVRLLPFLRITCKWQEIERCEIVIAGADERARPARRGYLGKLVRVISFSDLFGLSRFSLRVITSSQVRILPAKGRPTRKLIDFAASQGDSDAFSRGKPKGDFLDMRNYRRGESTRRVLWKVVARTPNAPREKWMVRMEEQVESRSCGVFLIPGDEDEASAELALAIVEKSLLGPKWIFGATIRKNHADTENSFSKGDVQKASHIIARSGNFPIVDAKESASQLREFYSLLESSGIQRCYILLPGLEEGSDTKDRSWLQTTLRGVLSDTQCLIGVRSIGDGEVTTRIARGLDIKSCRKVPMARAGQSR